MPTWQLCTRFQSYTATASTEAVDHPATNVALHRWPLRDWRATTGVGAYVQLDLGAAVNVGAYFVDDTNITSLIIEDASTAGGSYTVRSTTTMNVDRRCNRRKGWLATTTALRHIRLRAAALASGETVARIGTVAVMLAADIVTMAQNPGHPQFRPALAEDVLELPGGTRDVNTESSRSRVEYVLGQQLWRVASGVLGQVQDAYHAGT